LRINVQLVRVRDDFSIWSGQFDRELTDVFAIQDEISLGIVNNLRLKLGRGRRRYETSVEAYDLYLQARVCLSGSTETTTQPSFIRAGNYKGPLVRAGLPGLAGAYAARSFQGFYDHTMN